MPDCLLRAEDCCNRAMGDVAAGRGLAPFQRRAHLSANSETSLLSEGRSLWRRNTAASSHGENAMHITASPGASGPG